MSEIIDKFTKGLKQELQQNLLEEWEQQAKVAEIIFLITQQNHTAKPQKLLVSEEIERESL